MKKGNSDEVVVAKDKKKAELTRLEEAHFQKVSQSSRHLLICFSKRALLLSGFTDRSSVGARLRDGMRRQCDLRLLSCIAGQVSLWL